MENKILQIIGTSGSVGAFFLSISELLNAALTTLSLLVGISLGIWALCDKLKKRINKHKRK